MKKQLTLLSFVLIGAACTTEEPGQLPRSADPASVTVSPERRAPAVDEFAATVVSRRSAEIATRISGTVRSMPVQVGDQVRAGQAIVILDDSDIAAGASTAAATLQLAERSHERVRNLTADGAASQQELDGSAAALAGAQAGFRAAEAQKDYATVRAPFDGVVVSRSVDPGDLARPGVPLLVVVSAEELKIVADLPAHRLGSVSAGDAVNVTIDGLDRVIEATVARVVPALGAGSRTFRVEADLHDVPVGVRSGAFARVALSRAGEGPRWIPEDAIIQRGQLRGVFAVEGDTVRIRWVRLGQTRDGAVEVLSGPAQRLTVVRRPAVDLYDGRVVGLATAETWEPFVLATASGMEVGQ